jgi:hypothetical protein
MIREAYEEKPFIDLRGPDGNAWFLRGTAKVYGRRLGWSEEQIEKVDAEMTSGTYLVLIEVFDKYFGEMVDLIR